MQTPRPVFLLLLLSCCALHAAPAPLPRKPGRPSIPVKCVMRHCGSDWTAEFYPGGAYRARNGPILYTGAWRLDRGVLHVRERLDCPDDTNPLIWHVRLDAALRRGTASIGGDFVLTPTE